MWPPGGRLVGKVPSGHVPNYLYVRTIAMLRTLTMMIMFSALAAEEFKPPTTQEELAQSIINVLISEKYDEIIKYAMTPDLAVEKDIVKEKRKQKYES